MTKLTRKIKIYVAVVLLAYAAVGALISINYLVMYKTGELADLPDIVAAQQQNGGLYNGLSVGLAAYKYESYRQRGPEIVAIGTSRAMQIRDYFFTRSFYNLGGLVRGQAQAFALMDALLIKEPPKTVVFAVDFWTFCTGKKEFRPFKRPTETYHDGQGQPNKALLLWRLFAEGSLSKSDLVKILGRIFDLPRRALTRTGISTLITDSGFAADGSLYKLAWRGDPDPIADLENRSRPYVDALRNGVGRIPTYCRVSEEGITRVGLLGAELANRGINLVVIAPPVSGAVWRAMEKTPAAKAYMSTWRRRLKEAWPQTYDFTDPGTLAASDCEYYDGIHGGEVVYARIFSALARAANQPMAGLLNIETLDHIIFSNPNRITAAISFNKAVRDMELGGTKACISLPHSDRRTDVK